MAPTTMTSVTEPAAEHQIDIHTTAGKLADLRKRTAETLHPVGETAVEKSSDGLASWTELSD
jgi:propionyl-CoA carboxylase beta chain